MTAAPYCWSSTLLPGTTGLHTGCRQEFSDAQQYQASYLVPGSTYYRPLDDGSVVPGRYHDDTSSGNLVMLPDCVLAWYPGTRFYA